MSKPKTTAFPEKVFIYVCDHDKDGNPYYAVSTDLDGISEDQDGERIGSYSLEGIRRFKIERSMTNGYMK